MASDGMACQHAWAVDSDVRVIDKTWVDPGSCLYFGLALDVKTWAPLFLDRNTLP